MQVLDQVLCETLQCLDDESSESNGRKQANAKKIEKHIYQVKCSGTEGKLREFFYTSESKYDYGAKMKRPKFHMDPFELECHV